MRISTVPIAAGNSHLRPPVAPTRPFDDLFFHSQCFGGEAVAAYRKRYYKLLSLAFDED
jgi:hypothetical protein